MAEKRSFRRWLPAALLLVLVAMPAAAPAAMADAVAGKPYVPGSASGPTDYLVEVSAGTDPAAVAAAAGMDLVGQSMVRPSWYFMRPRSEMARGAAVAALEAAPGVVFALAGGTGAPPTRMSFTPNDPYFSDKGGGSGNPGQWHLVNTHTPGLDVNIQPAWNRGITGAGIVIGIVDDCLEIAHPDLAPNYRPTLSWDFGQNDGDPSPVYADDRHGTSVSGVAAARGGNGIGVTGAAPEAGLAGLRIDFNNWSDQQLIDATLYQAGPIRVKNHSYGVQAPFYSTDSWVAASRAASDAGVINVRAAGNERSIIGSIGDTYYVLNWGNANLKSLQADRKAITVAALGSNGQYAYYSNFGACVFVTAPSSGSSYGITTTDRTGSAGYSAGATSFPDADYTTSFGGTSSASPLVAGIVAQMLQVNPNLDVRGVKNILARTSRVVDPNQADWITNGAGLHFNPNYGFGLIDADAATQMAATYTQPPVEAAYTTGTVRVNAAILDNVTEGVIRSFTLAGNGSLESVEVAVDITHNYPGDLFIQLTSPSGTRSVLTYDHTFQDREMTGLIWTFSSAAFWGEDLSGTWSLQVADRWEIEAGMWNSYQVTAYAGVPEPATLTLLALGVAICAGRARRRRR